MKKERMKERGKGGRGQNLISKQIITNKLNIVSGRKKERREKQLICQCYCVFRFLHCSEERRNNRVRKDG